MFSPICFHYLSDALQSNALILSFGVRFFVFKVAKPHICYPYELTDSVLFLTFMRVVLVYIDAVSTAVRKTWFRLGFSGLTWVCSQYKY